MRIGELARRAGVSVKAVRYYESLGAVESGRLGNGYRDYDERQVALVREIRELALLGIRVEQARPFLDCLVAGNGQGDDCADSIAAYRRALGQIDERMSELALRRDALAALLADAESRRWALSEAASVKRPLADAAPTDPTLAELGPAEPSLREPLCAFTADRLASADRP